MSGACFRAGTGKVQHNEFKEVILVESSTKMALFHQHFQCFMSNFNEELNTGSCFALTFCFILFSI